TLGERDWTPLAGDRILRELGYELAYPLRREDRTVGLMLVDAAADALTPDARTVLEVLAGQVAIAIEDSRLVEENVRLERKLAQGERLAALGQMAAVVAHEVKNPLSAIKSIAQVMREDESLNREYARDLSMIVGETDRLSRSVTQLLSFARRPPSSASPSRADELIRAAVELFKAEAAASDIKIECRVDAKTELDGDSTAALRDALSNLLINALQATPAGGRVRVEALAEERELLISVTDSGCGIAPELRERIWEPFFTTRQRGTGLGLAIVRRRVEEVGGSARLAPARDGEGARFELRVPAEKPAGINSEVNRAGIG
ncbi:MAG: ATP-binding protein, partial [Acidobacteriota bacterium]|nr:ATP-binding protein [Acidobacteriota bacterium]